MPILNDRRSRPPLLSLFSRGDFALKNALARSLFSRSDFGVGVGGQGGPIEAYTRTPIEDRPQPRHPPAPKAPAKSAHDRTRTCTPFPTLVPQTSLSTNSSTWAIRPIVSQIRHTNRCSGRDSNPHEVNPHRVLNPARLPIPPPERVRAQNTLFGCTSGAEGNRTPDLLNAIQALSRLSYGPSTLHL